MSRSSYESGQLFPDAAPEGGGEELACLEGSLETLTFFNEENGFTIAKLRTFEKELVTILATLVNPVLGETMQLWGRWQVHPKFGPQFKVERYQVLKPVTPKAIERYLSSNFFKGIGPNLAKLLVAAFGAETIDIIEKNPVRLTEVTGIGKKKAAQIVRAWQEHHEVHTIMLFLQGHGISAAYATKIYHTYGDKAIEQVTANPYRLAQDVFGIGFKVADRIAQQLGMAQDMPERIEAGVLFCLRQAEEQGHCFLPEEALSAGAVEMLTSPPVEGGQTLPGQPPTITAVNDAIERLVRRQLLVRDTAEPELKPIYLKSLFVMEQVLARNLRKLIEEPLASPWLPDEPEAFAETVCTELQITPAPEQFRAVVECLRSRVLILTGGPGTGKTTTTRAILQAHLRCSRKVLLASPTGRAAKRLAEVTGNPALTIHRLLEVDPKSFQFKRGPDNPLECELLIVDEVSMVDLHLAYALVRALPEGAQLILVGDADQLPSVGSGNILHDLIASGEVPVVCLTEIFRQAAESTIITNAHKVNHGEMPDLPPTSYWQSRDCLFIGQDDAEVAAAKVCDVVARSLPSLGYKPEETQVLTPMQRGTLGAQFLNAKLQQALNPAQLGVAEYTRGQKTLRCRDRVIQTVNNYEKEVFNGDIGYIANIDTEEKMLAVAYPDREVLYTFEESDDLQLAYALTVHKSQGSEYPAVVVAFHTQHYMMLQRNLLYTALTRAKKLALLIGSKRAIAMAVRNQNRQERNTLLAKRLQVKEETPERVEW